MPWRDDDLPHDETPAHDERYGPAPVRLGARGAWVASLLVIAALIAGFRSFFFVDETEVAFVTQFGRPIRLCTTAGLEFKWPYQSVRRFDRRLRMLRPAGREMLTQDKENLNIEWFALWRLASSTDDGATTEQLVERFLQSVGDEAAAELRLEERLQAAVAAEIGKTRLTQLVSLEPGKIEWDAITARVLEPLKPLAREQFGIDLVDVRIRRFGYPASVTPAVFAEIRSERERVAVQYRAEGASEKARIESLATLQRDQMIAEADREASRIRSEADAKSMQVLNAAHGKNPRFYELLQTLETYRAMLDEQTTVVLSPDSPLLKLLTQGVPAPTSASGPDSTPANSTPAPKVTVPQATAPVAPPTSASSRTPGATP